ncbi:mannan endo-1,4-beta-mannosidase-like isoform X1 [Daphnia pulex]|nr:mannan endo-1,4-beta-mannosidase-like isoform X1 [Daphnia pulex]XP_046656601.1 mannan endo-1,4-beta-mannosidase-like [Daphnia pulicaria]
MLKLSFVLLLGFWASLSVGRLTTSGRDFLYNGQRVFLSGANIAWYSYGYDFGNGVYQSDVKETLETWLTMIANSGGNSVRQWVHVEGQNTPAYDSNGYVTGPDRTGTIIDDMRSFLDFAQSQNILVIFVLWNGAVLENQNTINLFYDDAKLQSYIDNALKPMVAALGDHPALAAWEIMNEPEGAILLNQASDNPCFDTTPLANTDASWTGLTIPMENNLKFVNWQTHAIKEANSASLVTLGSWSEHAQSDAYEQSRNYYTDACLLAAGGRSLGTLDFYQFHTYTYTGQWDPSEPFKVTATSYKLDKPLVIGEFATVCGGPESSPTLFQYSYDNGYQGVWSWSYNGGPTGSTCCDNQTTQDSGMLQLKGQNNGIGGAVNFPIVP